MCFKYFLSEEFGQFCLDNGTKLRPIAAEAHWQLGKAESHGGAAKYGYDKLTDEWPAHTPEEAQVRMFYVYGAKKTTAAVSRPTNSRSAGTLGCPVTC